jgi:hypothetical protein
MKKTFFLAGIISLLLTLAVNAQDTTSSKPTQTPATTQDSSMNPAQTQPMTQPATQQPATEQQQSNPAQSQPTTQEQKKYGNPTVDSILSKYTLVPMPSQLTTEQIFPVIGQYQSTADASQKVTVTLDDQNKGFAWVDGLPQGKLKAVLKKSPATYKIPAQKDADGKDIPEGTMIYDKDSKEITILLGRPFNDQDPASVFSAAAANTTTNANDQSQTMANNDQSTASKDQTKNDQSDMKVTKAKNTKSGKTKTKMVKPVKQEEPPYVFTGTKVEQVTSMNQ